MATIFIASENETLRTMARELAEALHFSTVECDRASSVVEILTTRDAEGTYVGALIDAELPIPYGIVRKFFSRTIGIMDGAWNEKDCTLFGAQNIKGAQELLSFLDQLVEMKEFADMPTVNYHMNYQSA